MKLLLKINVEKLHRIKKNYVNFEHSNWRKRVKFYEFDIDLPKNLFKLWVFTFNGECVRQVNELLMIEYTVCGCVDTFVSVYQKR